MGLFHYYHLDSAEVFIFDNYLINQIREGQEIELNHIPILSKIVQKHFDGRNFVYISNRLKSYSVNPEVAKELEKIPNLLAMIIISEDNSKLKTLEREKEFYNKPYKICKNIYEAIIWVDKILINNTK